MGLEVFMFRKIQEPGRQLGIGAGEKRSNQG
jgi:hypothetical protein